MELYIHIPFCIRKCAYCDFLSGPASKEQQERYVKALCREIRLAGAWHRDQTKPRVTEVTSVFIGGGTPSAIEGQWIADILKEVRTAFSLTTDAEITMEANPGTLTRDKLQKYLAAGVNRLSLGLQSTDNRELAMLGRIHTWEEFQENYQEARKVGFTNINIDLMSALPGQKVASWKETLQRVIACNPEHISAYSLIIEEDTPFFAQYGAHPELLPDEDSDREMYHLTKTLLGEAGYERYEISNYGKPGYACRHNVGYWKRIPYLGLGLGASSLYEERRFHNTSDLECYIRSLTENESLSWLQIREDEETLSVKDQMEEFMFLGLRLTEGVSDSDFQQAFGTSLESIYGPQLASLLERGLLKKTETGYRLTDFGVDVSNQVFVEFLL